MNSQKTYPWKLNKNRALNSQSKKGLAIKVANEMLLLTAYRNSLKADYPFKSEWMPWTAISITSRD